MKSLKIFKLIILVFACLAITVSCVKEGPIGPAGADGADGADGNDGQNGVDGNITCLVCHSGNNMDEKEAQFSLSVHKSGENAVAYAGGRASCARCHSHEGFVQYAEFGKVLGDISAPSAWKCGTCHGLHKTFESTDYALRLADPVVSLFDPDVTMDLGGNSNLCANCHQSRKPGPVDEDQYSRKGTLVDAAGNGLYAITSVYYGPHHGPQANVVAGVGFVEIPGSVAYPEAGSSFHLNQASCTGCHMAEFSNGQGGHTWNPSLDACNTCHGIDEDNFNYGGMQTNINTRLEELRDKLVELGVVEWVEEEGEFKPVVGTYPILQVQAFFNWTGLEEDRSLGVHNPKYVNALLINTLEALQ
ncbi:hypothetical protein MNBD_BACTEROID01-1718 [hydrothermal vent metagenome]|uniref:Uncharacterized protein n=1 Tax=hydrothermal vent metagenome TaxID=652676 RepID=A0A3B0U056_9ZZZZ